MKKKLDIIGTSVMILFFIYIVYIIYNGQKDDKIIIKDGYYCTATVTKKMVTKGNVGYFTFKYFVDSRIHYFERSVSDSFYKKNNIGDTIVVKYVHSKLPDALIIEEIKFQKCFGEQPKQGWKEVPICGGKQPNR
jgi:hypothetical protein